MAGIATLVLITTINLRMAEPSIRGRGFWYLFLSLPDYCVPPLLSVRSRNENVADRLPDLASLLPGFYDIIKNREGEEGSIAI